MQQHNADLSEATRARIARVVAKAASRLRRAVEASVRVERDGDIRRVEVVVLAPRRARIIATGEGRSFDVAAALVAERLSGRANREKQKRIPKARVRVAVRHAPGRRPAAPAAPAARSAAAPL
jgi:ribosome-associated translation inhibitor RaiA